MTVFYDQSNPFGTLFSWRGTAFKLIFQENREVYIYFSAHIIISVIHNFYMDLGGDYSSDLLDSLETSGFFLIFLLVFYNGHCYQRYLRFVRLAWQAWSRNIDIAIQCRAYLGPDDRDAHLVIRYSQAAHHLCYNQLRGNIDWECLKRRRLLSDGEIALLSDPGYYGSKFLLCVGWGLKVLNKKVSEGTLDPQVFQRIEWHLLSLRRTLGMLFDVDDNPIPFPYFHLLCCSLYLYLPVFTFCWSIKSMGSVAVLLVVPSFIGLREVSSRLANPFGHDDTDMPVSEILLRNLILQKSVLQRDYFNPDGASTGFEDSVAVEYQELRDMAVYGLHLSSNIASEVDVEHYRNRTKLTRKEVAHQIRHDRLGDLRHMILKDWPEDGDPLPVQEPASTTKGKGAQGSDDVNNPESGPPRDISRSPSPQPSPSDYPVARVAHPPPQPPPRVPRHTGLTSVGSTDTPIAPSSMETVDADTRSIAPSLQSMSVLSVSTDGHERLPEQTGKGRPVPPSAPPPLKNRRRTLLMEDARRSPSVASPGAIRLRNADSPLGDPAMPRGGDGFVLDESYDRGSETRHRERRRRAQTDAAPRSYGSSEAQRSFASEISDEMVLPPSRSPRTRHRNKTAYHDSRRPMDDYPLPGSPSHHPTTPPSLSPPGPSPRSRRSPHYYSPEGDGTYPEGHNLRRNRQHGHDRDTHEPRRHDPHAHRRRMPSSPHHAHSQPHMRSRSRSPEDDFDRPYRPTYLEDNRRGGSERRTRHHTSTSQEQWASSDLM